MKNMTKAKLKSTLKYIGETFVYVFVVFLLYESVIVAQDNQNTLNEMADRLNGLNDQVAEVKSNAILNKPFTTTKTVRIHKRESDIRRIEQWVGSKLKY